LTLAGPVQITAGGLSGCSPSRQSRPSTMARAREIAVNS
jgi:hypothetical protein